MPSTSDRSVLEALLDSWQRGNTILVNLLRAVPDDLLDHRALPGGFSIVGMFVHIDACRRYAVKEDAPEVAAPELPEGWRSERDPARIEALLHESAAAVKGAVAGRIAAGRDMDVRYDHPILMLQHLIWHEAYHHGQIKLILKQLGRPLNDDDGSLVTFDLWMDRSPRP